MHATPAVVLCDLVGESGGTERYLERVLPELCHAGLDLTILARRVDRPDAFGVPAIETPWAQEHERPSTLAAAQVERRLARMRPAVVITSNVLDAGVLRAVRLHAPRWLARVHDQRPFCPNGDRVFPQFPAVCKAPMGGACAINALVRGCVCGPRAESFERIARRGAVRDELARADRVLVSSAAMALQCERNGIEAARVALTPPPLPRDAYGSPPENMPDRSIVFAGRLTPQKGLSSLLRALARIDALTRPRLIVAGSGDDEEPSRALARRLGIEVEWRGWLDQRAMRAAVDASAAVVIPSLWPEPFGLVGIEAQARGRPAVAYDTGGIRDWIDGAGLTARAGDERALAAAIEAVLDGRTWRRLARAAFDNAKTYDMDSHVRRMLALCAPQHAERVTCASL
ncbi:MAG TPA: glycosyltransferase [Candidatus Baltobacteraceae bacterium]|jgi:glycosyltransferase involved in cell wall biosynthesis